MKLGIVGLPNVGKSTLFNALTNAGAQSENFPFCTIEPNLGVVPVPDDRLKKLEEIYKPEKFTPAIVEFFDIAGLVKGANKGEGLGNKFLSHIREVDAIVHVVRCFDDDNVVHVEGKVNPLRDMETINLELIFSDLEIIEKRIERTQKLMKSGDKKLISELKLLETLKSEMETGKSVRNIELDDEEKTLIKSYNLLTSKPVLYAANVSEDDFLNGIQNNEYVRLLEKTVEDEKAELVVICAKIEEEISQLDDEDKSVFLSDLGIEKSGLDRLITSGYKLLGLISYFTAGPKEVRAWTITKGTKAAPAAGKIHTDFERGFIRAEIVSYNDLIELGSFNAAKEKGLVRSEGKEYVVQDADVILFRFNV